MGKRLDINDDEVRALQRKIEAHIEAHGEDDKVAMFNTAKERNLIYRIGEELVRMEREGEHRDEIRAALEEFGGWE